MGRISCHTHAIVLRKFRSNPKTLKMVTFHFNEANREATRASRIMRLFWKFKSIAENSCVFLPLFIYIFFFPSASRYLSPHRVLGSHYQAFPHKYKVFGNESWDFYASTWDRTRGSKQRTEYCQTSNNTTRYPSTVLISAEWWWFTPGQTVVPALSVKL